LQQDFEIQQLCDIYQQQLTELNACHSLLTVDQEKLAQMLAPYVSERGELVLQQPSEDILLFKKGLDLRLKEFEEDCKRIQRTERLLAQKIEDATTGYEEAVQGQSASHDSRIFKRLKEQQRLIEIQQKEIDQIRFEKEMLQEETRQLRCMAIGGTGIPTPEGNAWHGAGMSAFGLRQLQIDESKRAAERWPLPDLHLALSANQFVPEGGGQNARVRFPNEHVYLGAASSR
jgi:hypothetical protein